MRNPEDTAFDGVYDDVRERAMEIGRAALLRAEHHDGETDEEEDEEYEGEDSRIEDDLEDISQRPAISAPSPQEKGDIEFECYQIAMEIAQAILDETMDPEKKKAILARINANTAKASAQGKSKLAAIKSAGGLQYYKG